MRRFDAPISRAQLVSHGSLIVLSLLAWAPAASAQQPLSRFLRAAAERSFDTRAARASLAESGSRADQARAALLPSLTASASYTRNQQPIVAQFPDASGALQSATITAEDQIDARVQLDVPIVDVAAWSRFFGAEQRAEASSARLAAAASDVGASVVSAYYRLVAARALVESAEQTIATAEEDLAVVRSRHAAGLASEVDLHRARADVARAQQTRAEAELDAALAARQLEVLTGIAPNDGRAPLDDRLRPEAPLDRWLALTADTPMVRATERDARAAESDREAAWQAMLPVLSGAASERYTNAAGFGPSTLWALGVTLRWQLDFAAPAALDTSARALDRALVEAERAREDARTAIYEEWHRVRSLLERARAARVVEEASDAAARAARARYAAGTGTQLEVSQSERDLASAHFDRVRADADLRVARLTLRLRAGLPPRLGVGP